MTATTVVADKTVVAFHYTLKNSDGETLDSSAGNEPLAYLHGARNIVPGLEKELTGSSVGDKLDVVVKPEDGYGVRQGPEPQKVPLSAIPNASELKQGMQIVAQGPNGEMFPLWVVEMSEEHATLDHNHPLADVTLHFQVEIASIRPATSEELEHGHPHGPGGHHH
jgi:FKBP-type peptidyl-prolyl cis-trans isomerase SlyD